MSTQFESEFTWYDSTVPIQHTVKVNTTYDYERTASGMRWKFHVNAKLVSGVFTIPIYISIRISNPSSSTYYWDIDSDTFKTQGQSWNGSAGITYNSDWIEVDDEFSSDTAYCQIRLENEIITGQMDEWTMPLYMEGYVKTISNKSQVLFYGYPTIGQQHHFKVTAASAQYSHKMIFELNGTTQTVNIASGSLSTDAYWTPPIEAFARASPDSNRPIMNWTLEVYFNNALIGYTEGTTYLYVSHTSIRPTTAIQVSDNSGHFASYGYYLRGYSEIGISLNSQAIYDATIESEKVFVGTEELVPPDSIVIPTTFNGVLDAVVVDSRGTNASASRTITCRGYEAPQALEFSVRRVNALSQPDDAGEYCRVDFTVKYDKLEAAGSSAGRNSHKLFVEWISNDESISGSQEITISSYQQSGSYTFAADIEHSFSVTLELQDDIRDVLNPVLRTIMLSTAQVIMDWKVGGRGVGIGKVSEHLDSLDINPNWDVNLGDISRVKFNGDTIKLPSNKVIKEGDSGIWHYRLWEDGSAECYGEQSFTLTTSTLLNGWYVYQYHSFDYNAQPFPQFKYDPNIDTDIPTDSYIVGQSSTSDPRQPSNWLSLTRGGAPLTPVRNHLYKVLTDGIYKNEVYIFNGTYYLPYTRNMFYGLPICLAQSYGDMESYNTTPSIIFPKTPPSSVETMEFSIGTSVAVSGKTFHVAFECKGRWKE